MTPFRFARGTLPLLISIPHVSPYLPDELARRMTPAGQLVADTDWHVDRLYDFARAFGANMLMATHSRYVIDLNRAPDGKALYPGASNTELCPLSTFGEEAIYLAGQEPSEDEIEGRIEQYWKPYHQTIESVLERLVAEHGYAVLYDAHSIASHVPRFFEGKLTDLNLGTGGGTSADPALGQAVLAAAEKATNYTAVLNGRFKGGYITRQYGKPERNVHAVQLELSWATYMDETPPFAWRDDLASSVTEQALKPILAAALDWMKTR